MYITLDLNFTLDMW